MNAEDVVYREFRASSAGGGRLAGGGGRGGVRNCRAAQRSDFSGGGEKMNIRDELEEVVRHSYIVDSVATSLSNEMDELTDAVYKLLRCADRAMAALKQLEGEE